MNTSAQTNPPPYQAPLFLLGIALGAWALFFGILLPFFWPPAAAWLLELPYHAVLTASLPSSVALSLKPLLGFSVLLAAMASPFCLVLGFAKMTKMPSPRLLWLLRRIFALELFFGVFLWLIVDIIRLFQRDPSNLLHLQRKLFLFNLELPKHFLGLFLAFPLFALAISLLSSTRLRDHLGLVFTAIAYQCILLLAYFGYLLHLFRDDTGIMARAKQLGLFHSLAQYPVHRWMLLLIASLLFCGLVGLLLMSRGLRLRAQLLFSAPLWMPFFFLFFLWSLILNTTLYFLGDLLKRPIHPPLLLRIFPLSLLSLLLFPLMLIVDFLGGVIRQMGESALERIFPIEERATTQTSDAPLVFSESTIYATGALLLASMPLWVLPMLFFLGIRLFVYEAIILQLLGRTSLPSIPSKSSSSS